MYSERPVPNRRSNTPAINFCNCIGVKAGVPVWTDITTVSGTIRSELQGAGQPQEGQDHIEVRAKTVSGDIALSEV